MHYRFNGYALNFQLLCHAHKHLFCMHIAFTKDLYCQITKLGYFTGTLFINPEAYSFKMPY